MAGSGSVATRNMRERLNRNKQTFSKYYAEKLEKMDSATGLNTQSKCGACGFDAKYVFIRCPACETKV